MRCEKKDQWSDTAVLLSRDPRRIAVVPAEDTKTGGTRDRYVVSDFTITFGGELATERDDNSHLGLVFHVKLNRERSNQGPDYFKSAKMTELFLCAKYSMEDVTVFGSEAYQFDLDYLEKKLVKNNLFPVYSAMEQKLFMPPLGIMTKGFLLTTNPYYRYSANMYIECIPRKTKRHYLCNARYLSRQQTNRVSMVEIYSSWATDPKGPPNLAMEDTSDNESSLTAMRNMNTMLQNEYVNFLNFLQLVPRPPVPNLLIGPPYIPELPAFLPPGRLLAPMPLAPMPPAFMPPAPMPLAPMPPAPMPPAPMASAPMAYALHNLFPRPLRGCNEVVGSCGDLTPVNRVQLGEEETLKGETRRGPSSRSASSTSPVSIQEKNPTADSDIFSAAEALLELKQKSKGC